jgi:sugar lactone lactonase YvrE
MRTGNYASRFLLVSLATITALALSLGGCPPTTSNHNPVADAGPDQTVAAGALVTLNGTGSSDPDGNVLTFAWAQTGGTIVALSSATVASPTFTAPTTTAAQTLTFELTVNDGAGGVASDTVIITVQAGTPPAVTRLFIANFTGNNITSYLNPKTVNGNIAPDTNLSGAQTLLAEPSDIVVTSGGALIVSNFAPPAKITTYANADATNGNLTPNANVQGAATLLSKPTTLAVNTANDLVFVADIGAPNRILVYSDASVVTFNGNLAPTRTIQSTDLADPFGINFGANDELYVADNTGSKVVVFDNASNLNGTVAATRIITSAAFSGLFDVFVDKSDRMYVVNSAGGGNKINIFNNASTLNGLKTPDITLTVQGAVDLTAIAIDATNTGYIVDRGTNAVFAYDNIATRNGTFPPDRTISGSVTQLSGPIRVFLQEQ